MFNLQPFKKNIFFYKQNILYSISINQFDKIQCYNVQAKKKNHS